MGSEIKLDAQTRADEKMKDVRAEGLIPAVMYGAGTEAKSLKVKSGELNKVFSQAGESTLVNLSIDGKAPVKVIIKDIQKDALKNYITHVDFYTIDMTHKIEVEIPLHFVGEARAVKELGGTLLKGLETIHVRCLPGDLIDFIEVDISGLNDFESTVRVSDLKIPANMEVINQESQTIATVDMPRSAKQELGEGETAEAGEAATEEKKEDKKEAKAE